MERCEDGENWCNDRNRISIVLFVAVIVVNIVAYFRYIDIDIIIIIIRHIRKL